MARVHAGTELVLANIHAVVQVLEPCFGQLTQLELRSSPHAAGINQAPSACPHTLGWLVLSNEPLPPAHCP
jgi:hypothetical protein